MKAAFDHKGEPNRSFKSLSSAKLICKNLQMRPKTVAVVVVLLLLNHDNFRNRFRLDLFVMIVSYFYGFYVIFL